MFYLVIVNKMNYAGIKNLAPFAYIRSQQQNYVPIKYILEVLQWIYSLLLPCYKMAGDFTNELVSVLENMSKFTCSLTVLSSMIQFPQ